MQTAAMRFAYYSAW